MSSWSDNFQGFGNSISDIATGLQTLSDSNASPMAKVDAVATITNAVNNPEQ